MSMDLLCGTCQQCMGDGKRWEDRSICKSCLGTGKILSKDLYDKFEPYHEEYAIAKKEGLTLSENAYAVISHRIFKNTDGKKYPNICPYCKSGIEHEGINGVQYVCGFVKSNCDKLHRPHARTRACKLISAYMNDYAYVRNRCRDRGMYYTNIFDVNIIEIGREL